MLTGKLPYGAQLEKVKKRIDVEKLKYKPMPEIDAYIPRWFDQAISKALAIEADERYQDIDEFIYALEHPGENTAKEEKLINRIWISEKFWKILCFLQFLIIALLLAKPA